MDHLKLVDNPEEEKEYEQDLTPEQYREYFNIETGRAYRIVSPVSLNFTSNDPLHYVTDDLDTVHCILGPTDPRIVVRLKMRDEDE